MKKILTFLGNRLFDKPTSYTFDGKDYEGFVFGEALRQFVEYDEMVVFVTEQAEEKAYPVLAALRDERIRPLRIPTGETTEEQWAIFEAVTGAVEEGDEVSFDITHGLRSLPFLVFLAAAFLKSAKQVKIAGIYYGAFELQKDSSGNQRPAPVIELSEFVTLLDWLNGSEQFIHTGNAAGLVRLLRAQRPPQRDATPEVRAAGKQLSQAASALEETSRALRLILPDQAMTASEQLQGALGAAAGAIQQHARPFTVLANQVTDSYAPLALADARDSAHQAAALIRERNLIGWYLERNLVVQAMAVAREWLVSWTMLALGFTNVYDKAQRGEVDRALGGAIHQRPKPGQRLDDALLSNGRRLTKIPRLKETLVLFGQIGDLRNELLHAGKRPHATEGETLERNARTYCERLNEWPVPPPDLDRAEGDTP